MAVSGTNNFSVTRDDIIKASLRSLGVLAIGETPETEDYLNCSQALNIMIKSWAQQGFALWVYESVILQMMEDVHVYPLGPTAAYVGKIVINNGGSGYPSSGTVTLTGGGGSGATGTYTAEGGVITAITVTAGGNSYTSAPTVSFSGAGTGADATAFLVGITMSRPLRIIQAFMRNSNRLDIPLTEISRNDYNILGSKFSLGQPNQYYYDNQLPNGQLYVYSNPVDSDHTVHLQVQRQFYDMNTGSDEFDFPQEAFQALKWGLCAELCAEYMINPQMITYIEQKAQAKIDELFNWSQEDASVYFSLDPQMSIQKR
jgi:hypothetical protein